MNRPNIIIFNPDEMRWDTMSHMGNPAASTPFLDQFAKEEAVSFRQAFCQNPVCVPSRCSFFTGLYPHVHGHRTMSYLLHPGEDNLFSQLKEAGYYIWMNARNDLFAGQIEGWAQSNADEIFYGGQTPKAPGPLNSSKKDEKEKYSHFKGILGLDDHGCNYTDDDEAVDAAISRLMNPVDQRPICIFLGLMYPHVPYQIEEPYFSRIAASSLPPRVLPENCQGKSRMIDRIRLLQHMEDYTQSDWDKLRTVYLAMCSKVDHQFKRLCHALKTAGSYDSSAIFFFSDHGDFAGDYGLTEKAQNSMEDCLTRVPLLIKPPVWEKVDPGISDSLAELIDFYATVLDYTGVAATHTHFGCSLRPVIENRKTSVRSFVHCEGGRLPKEHHCDEYHSSGPDGPDPNFAYWPKLMAQTDDYAHAKTAMIRNHHYKYIHRFTGESEFYDLDKDPQETINRFRDSTCQNMIHQFQLELLNWYQMTCDVVPFQYDRRYTEEMMWAKVKQICPPDKEALVRQKIQDGIKMGALLMYVETLTLPES